MYEYQATILDIHDGDSLKVRIDLGMRTTRIERLRLYGINAPELSTPEGKAARAYLQTLLKIGDTATIRTHKDKQEKYGRWLAEVLSSELVDVNASMVSSGHAVRYMV